MTHTPAAGSPAGPHKVHHVHKDATIKGMKAEAIAPSKTDAPPSPHKAPAKQHKAEPLATVSPAKHELPSAAKLLYASLKGNQPHQKYALEMAGALDQYVETAYPRQLEHAVKHALETAQAASETPLTADHRAAIAKKAEARVLKRFTHSLQFFVTVDARKDPPLAPLERMCLPFMKLSRPPNSGGEQQNFDKGVAGYSESLIKLAFDQHYDNPEQYVSHGFDHSINVANYTRSVLALNPEIVAATAQKYHISNGEAEFVLETVALLHDCGYPCVGCRAKSVHGISGADLVLPLRPMFDKMITSAGANKELLFNDFRNSILFHSADKIEQAFTSKIMSTMGTFLADHRNVVQIMSNFYDPAKNPIKQPRYVTEIFVQNAAMRDEIEKNLKAARQDLVKKVGAMPPDAPKITIHNGLFHGRFADLEHNKDRLLGLEFTMTDLLKDPLTMIRLVDNMDMSVTRFSPVQNEGAFRFIYNRLGDNQAVSQFSQALEHLEKEVDHALRPHADALKRAGHAKKEELDKAIAHLTQAVFIEQLTKLKEKATPNDPFIKLVSAHIKDADIKKLQHVKDARHLLNKAVIEATFELDAYAHLPPERRDEIHHIAMPLSSADVRHFGGCEAVRGVKLVKKPAAASAAAASGAAGAAAASGAPQPAPLVIVTVDLLTFNRLNAVRVTETSPSISGETQSIAVGVGEYQIWRANDAYRSILVGGENIQLVIEDLDGHPVASTIEVL